MDNQTTDQLDINPQPAEEPQVAPTAAEVEELVAGLIGDDSVTF